MKRLLYILLVVLIPISAMAQRVGGEISRPRQVEKSDVDKSKYTTSTKTKIKKLEKNNNELSEGRLGGHPYVDLGLSVKWATCNLGANTPYEFGSYYAWGEIATKLEYTKDNYSFYEGNYKYTYIGDEIKTTSFDVVSNNWSRAWRIPTKAECQELISRCEWVWTSMNNVFGYKIKGPNGNSIFLPASGFYGFNKTYDLGLYWTSTYNKERGIYGIGASAFSLGIYKPYSDGHARLYVIDSERFHGYTIRPVCN